MNTNTIIYYVFITEYFCIFVDKKATAYLLAILSIFSICGIGHFYLGKVKEGIILLISGFVIPGIILILTVLSLLASNEESESVYTLIILSAYVLSIFVMMVINIVRVHQIMKDSTD